MDKFLRSLKMSRLLVVFSVMIVCLSTLSAASKCDDKIIKQIKKRFWNNNRCPPKELFRKGAFWSPEVIMATTLNYYPDEKDINCAFTYVQDTRIVLYIDYFNSTRASCEEPAVVIDTIEKDGVLIDEENDIYIYHVYAAYYGVTAIYRCSKEGEKGPPEGMIKVSAHGYIDHVVPETIEDMASLGIYMSDKPYSDECVRHEVHG